VAAGGLVKFGCDTASDRRYAQASKVWALDVEMMGKKRNARDCPMFKSCDSRMRFSWLLKNRSLITARRRFTITDADDKFQKGKICQNGDRDNGTRN
jgi:hypothetical protein